MKRFLLISAIASGIGIGVLMFVAAQPYRNFNHQVLVDLPKGTSSGVMAQKLADAGVIRHPLVFQIARLFYPTSKLQAGEYEFADASSPLSVVERIARGDVHYYELSIREGSTIFDIAEGVDKLGFLKKADFLKAARNPAAIHDLAPKAPTLEGFLFPATYRLTRSTTVDQLIRMMLEQFRRQWKIALHGSSAKNDVLEKVTLASLVEKESGVPYERRIVASVYQNRLDQDIKLECDPTTIYASILEGRWRGTIYKSDLASENPYNTYRVQGLPPGPIANPGLASLEAAVRPAETKYLFFVAKGDGSGGHNFSTDYQSHQRFVGAYRRARASR